MSHYLLPNILKNMFKAFSCVLKKSLITLSSNNMEGFWKPYNNIFDLLLHDYNPK